MNDREKLARVAAVPKGRQTQRHVLGVVLMLTVDGWCTATRAEIAYYADLHPATVTRAINALVPDHLERYVQRPLATALKPAQRRTTMRRSNGAGGSRSTAHPDAPLPYGESRKPAWRGDSRVRAAAELARQLRGTNVVDFPSEDERSSRPKKNAAADAPKAASPGEGT